jgi:hypothetical protein
VVYDGKVVLIIEGLESFKDLGSNVESNIKFWLPKTFPKNIKVITTAAKSSKAYKYLKKNGCQIIKLRSDSQMLGDKITALDNRQYFCELEHRDRLFAVINQRIKERKISSLFMKTAIACLAPYASKGIINYGEVDPLAVQRILASFDISQIENLADTDQLIYLMLDYFDDKIMDPEKFKMVFCCMILTFKGLRISEIMNIVSSKILHLLNF